MPGVPRRLGSRSPWQPRAPPSPGGGGAIWPLSSHPHPTPATPSQTSLQRAWLEVGRGPPDQASPTDCGQLPCGAPYPLGYHTGQVWAQVEPGGCFPAEGPCRSPLSYPGAPFSKPRGQRLPGGEAGLSHPSPPPRGPGREGAWAGQAAPTLTPPWPKAFSVSGPSSPLSKSDPSLSRQLLCVLTALDLLVLSVSLRLSLGVSLLVPITLAVSLSVYLSLCLCLSLCISGSLFISGSFLCVCECLSLGVSASVPSLPPSLC